MKRLLGAKTIGALLVAPALLLAAACADEANDAAPDVEAGRPADFQATPAYLSKAVAETEDLAHRYEGTMSMGIASDDEDVDIDAPIMTGSSDGVRSQMSMDMGALFEQASSQTGEDMPAGLEDMAIDQVIDTSTNTMYIRAPFFADLAGQLPSAGGSGDYFDALSELGDKWGRADLSALGEDLPTGAAAQLGQNMDPSQYLEILAGADEVEELDGQEIDGEPMTGVAATVSFGDMLEAQGLDPDSFGSLMGEQLGDLDEFDFTIEVWIDREGHIRRMVMDMGDAMEELVDDDDAVESFQLAITLDFFDYGDESIEVEVPDEADTVDITEAFRAMAEELAGS